MRRYIIIYISIFLTATSCEKFLEREPQDQVSVDELFADLSGAKAALSGVYLEMLEYTNYNGPRLLYPDLVGGNLSYAEQGRSNFINTYHFLNDAINSDLNNYYADIYNILHNINQIITRVPDIDDGTQLQRNDILGQAYALRALLHLDLVLFYAQSYSYSEDASHLGIIIADRVIDPKSTSRARATVDEVYEFIRSDLDVANSYLENRTAVFTGNSKIYFSVDAVNALRARTALLSNEWQEAYDYSTLVINQKYSLYSSDNYLSSWQDNNTSESIFELQIPNNYSSNTIGHYYLEQSGNSYFTFVPSEDLISIFDVNDVRRQTTVFKYPTFGADAYNLRIFRLSEMYLIRAEASAELNNTSQALSDLNTIRLRANPATTEINISDKDDLVKEILMERRRELCFEGFTFFDLTRRRLGLTRNDCTGENCNVSYPSDLFVLPIPSRSVEGNSNMVQNPGY